MPARRRDPVSVPRTLYSSRSHNHDYGIDESISRAGLFSNAVLDDTHYAAARSRGKDYDLLRNANNAIRLPTPRLTSPRISRPISRYSSLPPTSRKTSPSSTRASLIASPASYSSALSPQSSIRPWRSITSTTPGPTSLLSSKINMFLRGSSLSPGVSPSTNSLVSYKSYLDSSQPPPPTYPSLRDEAMSVVAYKSHLSDPSITSPFSTRSSSRLYHGYNPSSSLSSPYRFRSNTSSSLPRYNISLPDDDDEEDYDYGGSDDDEYEAGAYRRKCKILQGRQALPPRSASTLYYTTGSVVGSDDEDDDSYCLIPEERGTYTCSRPLGTSPLRLSSYEGTHDGTYESDMADMYDYVPFGPSRQGVLELTQRRDNPSRGVEIIDVDEDDDDLDSSLSYPSPSRSFLTSYPSRELSPTRSYSVPPSSSLYSKPSSGLTISPTSSFANNTLFDSVLSSTAARARAALSDSDELSPYRNASLVMSVEGSAVSEDGKNRYGFRYYPPPIPLKGSGMGLDERILGVTPKPVSPADNFFNGYLNRLKNLRADIEDRENKADSSYGRSALTTVPRPLPSYTHSTVHMPVHTAGRCHSVPVSSYRSPANSHGLSHRVDVFPLVVGNASLGKEKIHIPLYKSDGKDCQLTMLEKINIKIATETHSTPRAAVASMRARASSVPPKIQARPVRLQQQLNSRPARPQVVGSQYDSPTFIYLSSPPVAHAPQSKPVVSTEVPWRMRAGSLPPRPRSYHPGLYEPMESQIPLGTENLRAHRAPPVLRSRAGSVPPPQRRPQTVHYVETEPLRNVRARSVQPAMSRSYQPGIQQPLATEGLRAHRAPVVSRFDRGQSMSRLNRPYLDFDEEVLTKPLVASRPQPRHADKRKQNPGNRGISARAVSEPPCLIRPSENYPRISDVQPVGRRLFVRRGQVHPRSIVTESPLVYLPSTRLSNRAQAAIIGSKMEAEDGGKKKKKLRPSYPVDKSREPSAGSSQSAIYSTAPFNSTSLQSSRPSLPKTPDRKPIRTVDGFTKPKNVMSWEYRIESRISPDDLLYTPSRFGRMRDQLRGTKEKLDRHRQLMDRAGSYKSLSKETNTASSSRY